MIYEMRYDIPWYYDQIQAFMFMNENNVWHCFIVIDLFVIPFAEIYKCIWHRKIFLEFMLE